MMDSPKYSQFHVSKTTYKTVNGHDLATYILVPKNCLPGPRPIYVKFHGGFLVRLLLPLLPFPSLAVSPHPRVSKEEN
jgi:hypothetical protein